MSDLSKFRPMLSATLTTEEFPKLQFPMYCSSKLDGIRCCVHPTLGPVTRTLKPIPNKYIFNCLKHKALAGLDGELIVGSAVAKDVCNTTQSAVMSYDGEPEFTYYVFDHFLDFDYTYDRRLDIVYDQVNAFTPDFPFQVLFLSQELVRSIDSVIAYEESCHELGYEGAMVRSPTAPYKFGRATLKQQYLMKLKRFEDAEATIIGFEALERNTNEPTKDAFGLQKRSSHQAGKIADNLLGKLHVTADPWGEFDVGSGLDTQLRTEIWNNQDKYKGATITFKYLPYGSKLKPRHPIFKGFRHD